MTRILVTDPCVECSDHQGLLDPEARVEIQGWWYCYSHGIIMLMQLGHSVLGD